MDRESSGRAPRDGDGAVRKKKTTPVYVTIGRVIGRIFLVLFTLCVIGIITCAIFFKIFLTYIETTLIPSLGELSSEEMTLSLASTIYDKNGSPILTLYDNSEDTGGNRELITYKDLPKHLVDALVAIEDHRFWEHHGVDWLGTAGAIRDTITGRNTRGGSTITQQVLRYQYQDDEVIVKRKLREIFRALEYEKVNSKEDIITEYLNTVFFGNGCYGIQTAAKSYFGKDVSELDVAESAAIIGITNNPSLYDPFYNVRYKQKDGTYKTPREFNKVRQELILDQMVEYGYLTKAEAEAAKAEKLLFTDTDEYKALHGITVDTPEDPEEGEEGEEEAAPTGSTYTWLQDAAINDAIELLMEELDLPEKEASKRLYRAGYHIYTTLDPDIQAIVDEVYENPDNFNYPSPTGKQLDSAITVVDPYTGDVVAMAGGVGVKTGMRGLNLATSPRTPGSSIKPVAVYAPALEYDVVSPGTVWDDYPLYLNSAGTGGFPKNDPSGYRGYTTVASGVQRSVNTIASRTMEALGYSRSYEFMVQRLGFTTLDVKDLALSPLAMGGLTYGVTTEEMAAAYGAFVNKGLYTRPRTITRIESNDHSEIIVDNSPQTSQAMKETTAYLMTKMLRSVMTGGTGTRYVFDGMSIAGKTGTTNNKYDRYFAGFTPYYSAAVWVGYKDKAEVINSGKVNPAAAAWKMVMEKIHENLEDIGFPEKPDGLITVSVCADCGKKAGSLCSSDYRGGRVVSVEIQASAAPAEACTCHVDVRVCTNPETGEVRMAGPHCPEDTVHTRVMLEGRTFLEIPYGYEVTNGDGSVSNGKPLLADDSEAHLTYFRTLGTCKYHDENYVPDDEPLLPGEGDPSDGSTQPGGTTQPGDSTGWPTEPFDPTTVGPGTSTGTTEPDPEETEDPPSWVAPQENDPDEPGEPSEPDLPDEPDLP